MSSSEIVTCTDDGLPAVTEDGRLASATVTVSSSVSSSAVETVPVPVVWPASMVMDDSGP